MRPDGTAGWDDDARVSWSRSGPPPPTERYVTPSPVTPRSTWEHWLAAIRYPRLAAVSGSLLGLMLILHLAVLVGTLDPSLWVNFLTFVPMVGFVYALPLPTAGWRLAGLVLGIALVFTWYATMGTTGDCRGASQAFFEMRAEWLRPSYALRCTTEIYVARAVGLAGIVVAEVVGAVARPRALHAHGRAQHRPTLP